MKYGTPKGDRVLVRKLQVEDEVKTKQGLVLVGEAIEALNRNPIGIVLAAGPGCKETHAGEIVLYQRYGGTEIRVEGVDLLIFRESEILMGLDEDALG